MAALAENLTSAWSPLNWTLLFARQPEPDLEFTEEELDQTITTKARGPVSPRKKPGGSGSPVLWILILVLVGGIAYISMQPELLTELLSPYLDESTPPPPTTPRPIPKASVPPAPPIAPPESAPSPSPVDSAPPAPATPPAAAVAPSAPAVAQPPQAMVPPATPVTSSLDPMFSEGQKVTVTADDNTPGGNLLLFADSSGSKPGPTVRAGTSLTIMDGDLQSGNWMYLVRTDEGLKGWVSEKRLRLKF